MTARIVRASASSAGIVLLAVTVAAGQRPPASGGIAGRVVDSVNAAMPGATVIARPYGRGTAKTTTSRPDGTYEIAGLADGPYMVDATLAAFDIARRHGVEVRGAVVSGVDLRLDISPMCECIEVKRAGAPVMVQGTILDGRGNPLPHAALTMAAAGLSETSYADDQGRFRARVPEGAVYTLTSAFPGFVTQTTTVRVREAARGPMTLRLDMVRDPAAPGRPESERLSRGCVCPGNVFVHTRR